MMDLSLCIILVIQIAVLSIQSADARNFPLFGIKAKKYHPWVIRDTTNTILNVPKGGSNGSDDKAVVGVIDLRPDKSSSVFGNNNNDNNNTLCDAIIVSNSIGTFPVSTLKEEEEEYDNDYDHIMNLQSAAAETIGTCCDSVCLFVSYDPKAGKTVLHRTAGIKLAGVVNGMRQRQQQSGSSVHPETTTRVTVFLFCHGTKPHMDDDWDPKGAEYLVEKLKTFFAMGIDDDNNNNNVTNACDTFENIDIVPLWKLPNNSNEEATAYQQLFSNKKWMTKAITTDSIKFEIQNTYDKMAGGTGQILYDDVVLERK